MLETILYIFGAVVGFFVLMNAYVMLSGWMKRGKKLENLRGELGKQIMAGKRLLIYFYSPSCTACKTMTPVVSKLNKENKNVQMVNLATDMEIGRKFGVMGTPATVIVENERIEKFLLGARSEQFLRNLL
jgi:thioredoxin 1